MKVSQIRKHLRSSAPCMTASQWHSDHDPHYIQVVKKDVLEVLARYEDEDDLDRFDMHQGTLYIN